MIILQQNIQNTPRPKQGNWEIVQKRGRYESILFYVEVKLRGQITCSKQSRNFNLQI